MNQERVMKVLLAPIVSEKSAIAGESNQVVFRVVADATKPEIRAAVEKMFEVDVESVRVVNLKGKTKRFGARFGRRSDTRKAYVRLKEGQEIDFMPSA
ncbi:50S ribosomal protein L23 [Solemya elarraichensis gill symbiont]|uniref:Large ribosomal subunit protein uL23 n=1 Tax=Solemya elarraichensis gill symbiont TaxID=1918949 RepID=A0A1T2LCC3_9GAMM|nr:50S ribosomal protein L23 [Solemya elarraichensis gill symbiont]OOZ42753.1 50S ribosomal protein L23 [Solemya elarraichensis gill symbiont]